MHSQENVSDSILFSIAVARLRTFSFTKKENHVTCFFTEDSWITASDSQQHFGHINCFMSSKLT